MVFRLLKQKLSTKTNVDEYELDELGLMQMIALDRLAVGLVVSNDRLREGDAQVLDGHLVVLIGRGHAPQVRTQVLERFVVVARQSAEQLFDEAQPHRVRVDAAHAYEFRVEAFFTQDTQTR